MNENTNDLVKLHDMALDYENDIEQSIDVISGYRIKMIDKRNAEIILHPSHPDYCNECTYHGDKFGNCLNEEYNKHSYEVNCVWHYCPYKHKGKQDSECEE